MQHCLIRDLALKATLWELLSVVNTESDGMVFRLSVKQVDIKRRNRSVLLLLLPYSLATLEPVGCFT